MTSTLTEGPLSPTWSPQVGIGAHMSNPMSVSRRLVAVFAADVEGYSRLMGADEVGTLKGLTERRAILDRLIGEHRGRIANTAGTVSFDIDQETPVGDGRACLLSTGS